jgi:hypothetical protein
MSKGLRVGQKYSTSLACARPWVPSSELQKGKAAEGKEKVNFMWYVFYHSKKYQGKKYTQRRIYNANSNQKKAGVATFISEKEHLKAREFALLVTCNEKGVNSKNT